MSILEQLTAARPELSAGTPFVGILDALADAVLALVKVVDYVRDPDLAEEFALRRTDEQTAFGVAVTLASLALGQGVEEIGDAVAGVFEATE